MLRSLFFSGLYSIFSFSFPFLCFTSTTGFLHPGRSTQNVSRFTKNIKRSICYKIFFKKAKRSKHNIHEEGRWSYKKKRFRGFFIFLCSLCEDSFSFAWGEEGLNVCEDESSFRLPASHLPTQTHPKHVFFVVHHLSMHFVPISACFLSFSHIASQSSTEKKTVLCFIQLTRAQAFLILSLTMWIHLVHIMKIIKKNYSPSFALPCCRRSAHNEKKSKTVKF